MDMLKFKIYRELYRELRKSFLTLYPETKPSVLEPEPYNP